MSSNAGSIRLHFTRRDCRKSPTEIASRIVPSTGSGQVFGSYLYDRVVPIDHLLRNINQVVDFSFARQLFEDRYHPDIGSPA
ncbi:MAG: hypothetical protein Q8O55_12080 [Dehalococcoidales bacterium]|nr:hypothetical protein [Dehalococcoidales bacterium]